MATYKNIKAPDGSKIQVESAVRDGEGKNISNNYAKQDGYYETLGSGTADVAKAIESDRQIENPENSCPPITFGVTGGEAEIQSGYSASEDLEGRSQVWNQLVQNGNFASVSGWSNYNCSLSVTNNIGTITATANNNYIYQSFTALNTHKVLALAQVNCNSAGNVGIRLIHGSAETNFYTAVSADAWIDIANIVTLAGNVTQLRVAPPQTSGVVLKIKNLRIFDLTAMNYPMTGLTNDQIIANFKKDYPLDYYDYNAGTILSAKSASLISTGKNQFNTLDTYIRVLPNTEYELSGITAGGYIEEYDANKNLIQISTEITSTTDITLTASTYYVKIQATTYSDIMFYNTFADNGPGSGVYSEPYEEYWTDDVELPNIELRRVGNIKDVAYQNGGGKRYVGYVDLGSLTWSAWGTNTTGKYRMLAALPAAAKSVSSSQTAKMLCPRYTSKSMDTVYSCVDGSRGITDISGNSYIGIYDKNYSSNSDVKAFKTSMSGVYLCYELASPSDIPISENPGWKKNIKVDNFGTLEFTTDPAQVPQIEQPYFIKYTVNLVEFLDSTYVHAGGDANKIALLSDVEAADNEVIRKLEEGEVIPALSENFDTKMTIEQDTPYLFRTAGGSSEIATLCRVKEIEGASVVWNQLIPNGNFASGTTGWNSRNVTISASNGVMSIVASESSGRRGVYSNILNLPSGLVKVTVRSSTAKYIQFVNSGTTYPIGSSWQTIYALHDSDDRLNIESRDTYWTQGTAIEVKNIQYFNLTKMFGPTLAAYISSLETQTAGAGVALFKSLFPKDYYAYTATPYLLNVTTSGKKYVGFNAYNNETGTAQLVGGNEYQVTGTYTVLSFTDINGVTSTPTLDENNCFTPTLDGVLTITGGNTTDTCVNLYWDGEREGDFEAYEEHTYLTDSSVELRGNLSFDSQTGNVVYDGDTYEPDGTITRKYAVDTLTNIPQFNQLIDQSAKNTTVGQLTMTRPVNSNVITISGIGGGAAATCSVYAGFNSQLQVGHTYCVYFVPTDNNVTLVDSYRSFVNTNTPVIVTNNDDRIVNLGIRVTNGYEVNATAILNVFDLTQMFGAGNEPNTVAAFTTMFEAATYYGYIRRSANRDGAVKCDYLTADYTNYLYKLITPTTEETQATAYNEVQVVDNWGTEEWLTSGNAVLPVGNDTIYLPDLKAKLEAAPEAPDNEGYYIVFRDGNDNRYILADSLLAAYVHKPTTETDLTSTSVTVTLSTNTRYNYSELTALTPTFPSSANDGDEITINFVSGSTATTWAPDTTNAIYNFTTISSNVFVELNAEYKISINKWVVIAAETEYTVWTAEE